MFKLDVRSSGQGKYAELLFVTKCILFEIDCYVTVVDENKIDCIIKTSDGFKSVQVKSTTINRTMKDGAPSYCVTNTRTKNSKIKSYSGDEFDILAIYIVTQDIWYIINDRELFRKKLLRIRDGENSDYNKFKNNWDLLK